MSTGLLNPGYTQSNQKIENTTTSVSYYYHLTTNFYTDNVDMDAICISEFGADASLADWTNVKIWIASLPDGMNSFYSESGMSVGGICYLKWNGVLYNGSRHYFIQQFNSYPSGFLVHDSYLTLYLGSWSGMNIQLLAQVPSVSVPVNMTSFSSLRIPNGIKLTWTTETEQNNSGFKLTRSINNSAFEEIAFVEGKGTTNENQSYSFFDLSKKINSNQKVIYRMFQVDFDGKITFAGMTETENSEQESFIFSPNYPNPFNPVTTIDFSIPKSGNVNIKIYDIMGREVQSIMKDDLSKGFHSVLLSASNLSSGHYFCSLIYNGKTYTRKITVKK